MAKDLITRITEKTDDETPAQKANRLGVPLIPKKAPPMPFSPNPVISVCGECGHEVRTLEYYSCPLGNCPFGNSATLN
jgi:hypothetical protein